MLTKKLLDVYEANYVLIAEFDGRFKDSKEAANADFNEFLEKVRQWTRECIELGRFIPDESGERRALQGQIDYWISLLRRHRIRLEESRLSAFDASASVPLDAKCPYPGLRAYGSTSADSAQYQYDIAHFLGRDEDIAVCMGILKSRSLLSIVAGSGTGKSSLVLAGILPRVRKIEPSWRIAPRFTPGSEPMRVLATALASGFGESSDTRCAAALAQLANASPSTISEEVKALVNGQRVMLFIDQFEELFSLCRDASQRASYARVLRALAYDDAGGDWPVRIITTMRTDFLGHLERLEPELYKLMKRGEMCPDPLDFAHLKQVIQKPASAVGLRFAPLSIVDDLAGQAASLSAGLPLLQFALYRLWAYGRRDEHGTPRDLITQADVDLLPSVQFALSTAMNELYKDLSESGQRICHRLTLELAEIADNAVDPLRRRRNEPELVAIVAQRLGVREEEVRGLIDRLVDESLLVRSGEGEQRQVEVAHEALFVHWPKFRDEWLIAAKAQLVTIKTIEREAADWHEGGKREDLLKQKGDPLNDAKALQADKWLSADAMGYVEACAEYDDRETTNKRELQAKVRKQHMMLVSLFVLCLIALVAYTGISQIERSKAATQSALVGLASMLNSLPASDAISVASYLSGQNPGDERFTRALLEAKDRIADVPVLKDESKTAHFVSGWRAVVGLPRETTQKDNRVIVHVLGANGSPINSLHAFAFAPPAGFDSVALTGAGPAIGIGRDSRDSDEQLVWLAWTSKSRKQVRLQAFSVSWTRSDPQFEAQTTLNTPQVGSFALSDDGTSALVVGLDPPAQLGDVPKTEMHEFKLSGKTLQEQTLASSCGLPAAGSPESGDVIILAAFLRSNGTCPVTARADGSIVCPNGYRVGSAAGRAPRTAIYPSPSGDTFATYSEQDGLRLEKCASDPADQDQKDWETKEKSPLAAGFDVKDVAFGNNSIFAITSRQISCWALDSKGHSAGGYPCFTSIKADEMALAPTPDGWKLWYLEDANAAMIRSRAVPDLDAGAAEQGWSWALGGNRVVSYRNGPTGVQIGSRQENGGEFDSIDPAKGDGQVMTASVSGDGKWLVYGEQVNSNGIVHVFLQNLEKSDPPEDFGERKVVKLSLTRLAVALGADREPIVVLAAGDELYIRTTKTDWTSLSNVFQVPSGDTVSCLAVSHSGQRVLVNTHLGLAARLTLMGSDWVDSVAQNPDAGDVQTCAIADDGAAVMGDERGKVFLVKGLSTRQTPSVFEELTARAAVQLPTRVAAVSIDPEGHFASALGSPQALGCTELPHPGQTLDIWLTNDNPEYGRTPVARRCFVDADFSAIGAVDANGHIALYRSDQQYKPYLCSLCAHPGQAGDAREEAMLELSNEGMVTASGKDMDHRFGIKASPSLGALISGVLHRN